MNSLKDALEVIDNYTPLKDPDYWHFYDAIEAFLFGELEHSAEGEIWGINNFHSVWEALCLTYLVKNTEPGFLVYWDERLLSTKIINKFKSAHKIIDLSEVFRVNGTEVFPDAVIIPFEEMPLSSGCNFEIIKNNWDDSWYQTTFFLRGQKHPQRKIALANQSQEIHTFEGLKKIFQATRDTLTVDSPLPDKFYSFWDVPEILTVEELRLMRYLNHVFYRALESRIFSNEEFSEWIQRIHSNFVGVSLFRRHKDLKIRLPDAQEFMSFIKQLDFCFSFHIVDIKYSSSEDYLNPENAEEIKRRSVRKQFVYEYLLQKHLRDSNSPLKDWDITSEFWLPVYSPDSPALSPGDQYIDGYLNLTQVNIMSVIDSYLDTEST